MSRVLYPGSMRPLVILLFASFLLSAAPKKAIQPARFPAHGPFSAGILTGDGTLYIAGQIGRDLQTQKIPEEFEAEVKQALENVGAILQEAKMSFADVVSVTVYLTDMDQFARMNTIYTTYFPEPRPARATVGVARLSGNARIEISAISKK